MLGKKPGTETQEEMTMSEKDNVVRPTFGSPRRIDQSPTTRKPAEQERIDTEAIPLVGMALSRAQADLLYFIVNKDYVQDVRERLKAAGDFIFSLEGFTPDKRSIGLRRQGLSFHSLEALCAAFEITNEQTWRTQPSFIGALTIEIEARIQAAGSLLPDCN